MITFTGCAWLYHANPMNLRPRFMYTCLTIQIEIYNFSAQGQITVQMQCTLTESNAEILLLMPNILEWGYDKINLFELHIKSDTVIINYTTTEGKQRDFKFPLAGFKEKYLEQFI